MQVPGTGCVLCELSRDSNLLSRIHSWSSSHISGAGLFVFCLAKAINCYAAFIRMMEPNCFLNSDKRKNKNQLTFILFKAIMSATERQQPEILVPHGQTYSIHFSLLLIKATLT